MPANFRTNKRIISPEHMHIRQVVVATMVYEARDQISAALGIAVPKVVFFEPLVTNTPPSVVVRQGSGPPEVWLELVGCEDAAEAFRILVSRLAGHLHFLSRLQRGLPRDDAAGVEYAHRYLAFAEGVKPMPGPDVQPGGEGRG